MEETAGGHTILVIENHPAVREAIELVFKSRGLNVIAVRNGRSGLSIARQIKPDLIICNYRISGIDGLEVLETIRAEAKTAHIPFILMTSLPSRTIRDKCFQLGADACIDKSTGAFDLFRIVPHLLRGTYGEENAVRFQPAS